MAWECRGVARPPHRAARGTTGSEATARGAITHAFVAGHQALRTQMSALEEVIEQHLVAHPDGHIFTSLPKSGTVRAARGCSPSSATAEAGTPPPRR